MGGESRRIRLVPRHAFGMAEGSGERRVRRRIEGCSDLRQATQRAGTSMRSRRAILLVLRTLIADAVADDTGSQRVGNSLASRRPASRNRRQHLHHQREQDNG